MCGMTPDRFGRVPHCVLKRDGGTDKPSSVRVRLRRLHYCNKRQRGSQTIVRSEMGGVCQHSQYVICDELICGGQQLGLVGLCVLCFATSRYGGGAGRTQSSIYQRGRVIVSVAVEYLLKPEVECVGQLCTAQLLVGSRTERRNRKAQKADGWQESE